MKLLCYATPEHKGLIEFKRFDFLIDFGFSMTSLFKRSGRPTDIRICLIKWIHLC